VDVHEAEHGADFQMAFGQSKLSITLRHVNPDIAQMRTLIELLHILRPNGICVESSYGPTILANRQDDIWAVIRHDHKHLISKCVQFRARTLIDMLKRINT